MWTILLAIAATLLACPADAQQQPALRFDSDRIEFATPWAQSSTCLADRADPLCTAQAILVCSIFSARSECADFPRLGRFSNPEGWTRVEYRIVAAGRVTAKAVREFDRATGRERFSAPSASAFVEPGMHQVRLQERKCAVPSPDCAGVPWMDTMVSMTREAGRWNVVNHGLFDGRVWLVD
jgi:hypothetical protein